MSINRLAPFPFGKGGGIGPFPTQYAFGQRTMCAWLVCTGVQVLDEEGKILEKGDATQGRGDWWEYVPSAEGKVVVEARDLAGNKVKTELVS